MSENSHNILQYTIALVADFASHYGISQRQALNYLVRFKGFKHLQDYYEKNASDYINRFKELDQKYSEVISTSKNKTLVFGDRFPLLYFAKDYGLNYYAAFKGCSNETEVSASTIKFLIDKAEQLKAPVIFKIASSLY